MTDQVKVDKLTIDGRRAEIHVQEQETNGITQRVTTQFEEIVPLEMKKRVNEKIAPVVIERITEEFDGDETKKTIERVADEIPTRLTDLKPIQPCISKEEITEIVKSVIEQTKSSFSLPSLQKFFPKQDSAPIVAVAANNQGLLHYALVVVLALCSAVLVWQWFIR